MMHTEIYCETLPELDTVKAIRAIHQAWLQLDATAGVASDASYDNSPALAALAECLREAGHVGFPKVAA